MLPQTLANQYMNFNSIKVRLKLPKPRCSSLLPSFQFHKGTIKTANQYDLFLATADFNSIKVRLKPTEEEKAMGLAEFQFHKGTIKTFSFKTIKTKYD